jgi:alpha-beta hydrolase superfamily lysophospholipase
VISWSGPSDLTAMVERDATRHDCTAASGCGTRDGLASSFAHSVMHCAPADCPSTYRDASPLDQVSQDDVPMLLINSTHELISTRQATEMAAALHRAHLAATVDLVPGSRHGSLLKPVTTSLTTRWLRRFAGAPENSTS